jgi:hypothetical protein
LLIPARGKYTGPGLLCTSYSGIWTGLLSWSREIGQTNNITISNLKVKSNQRLILLNQEDGWV